MNLKIQVIKDPNDISSKQAPMIVFSDNTSGFIEWLIKMRIKGEYNHIMLFMDQGHFVSQGNTYSRIEMSRYMKKGNRLLFVKINGLTDEQKKIIHESVERKLRLPWWKKLYDWPGIFGQAIGIKRLNINGLNYCSEDVRLHFIKVIPSLTESQSNIVKALSDLKKHGSPQDHRETVKRHPKVFELSYLWQSDI